MKKAFVLVAALCAWSTVSMAQQGLTVQYLYQACKQPAASPLGMFCFGLIRGIGTQMSVNGAELSHIKREGEAATYLAATGICAADKRTPPDSQLIHTFLIWAQTHPERWVDHAEIGVGLAFQDAWRCEISN
ncbi:MAG TPA: Rap1a/Tai family immunity protein [Rhizomicrobium sp.]|nr:Rap1a/Tai family immunity protein [Rhizomicrobium sp.]